MKNLDNLFPGLYEEAAAKLNSDGAVKSSSFQQLSETNDKYTRKELVALGGMKKVFRVYDNFAKRDLAMAMLYDDAPPENYDQFIHEAWLTSQLDHPNIITIHEVGINNIGRPYFTMDLKVGHNFKEIITGGVKVPLEELLEIFLKVCDAVAYAHSKNILHLDLKPNNIQIGGYGEVLVCDWGLGRLLVQDDTVELEQELVNSELLASELRRRRMVKGTPGFMAPEQVNCQELTKRTDVYELGSMLYSILTRKIPIEGSIEQVLKDTVAGRFIAPVDRVDHFVPESLNAVVLKAMQLSPEARYKSVINLRQDVHKYLMGYSTLAENAGFLKEFRLFYNRNRTSSNIVFSLFITVVIIIGAFMIGLANSRRNETVARKLAQKSQKKLEYTLKLFAEEKEAYSQVLGDYAKDVSGNVFLLNTSEFFRNPVKTLSKQMGKLDRFLQHDPEKGKSLGFKRYLLFISQQYKACYELSKAYKFSSANFLKDVITKFKLHEKESITIDELVDVINHLAKVTRNNSSLPVKMLYYDMAKRKSLKGGYDKLVEAVLKFYNPQWKKRLFSYNAKSKTLVISGKGLKKISYLAKGLSVSLIKLLPMDTLVLSGTELYDISQVARLKVKTLDISNTFVANVDALRNNRSIKKVIINEGQVPKEGLDKFAGKIEFVIR